MPDAIVRIREAFIHRGAEKYGHEEVTQLQHALHCAQLAINEGAADPLVAAAFLHDIGHILVDEPLPSHLNEDLDDRHEERGWTFLSRAFPKVVADSVRLHVAAKRWLCTVDAGYAGQLSPTSLKSYWDQGGPMSDSERKDFESHPHHAEAVMLRRWDDLAKDPKAVLPTLEAILDRVASVLSR